ncbi:MAG: transketolase, partial [Candidatus Roizmanbacteria bacterium]|nr:transketolase [Candidatus Roizmanbacteria bacterium]
DLEGHPTFRFKYADIATGSLGQGLSAGVGMALGMRLRSRKIGIETGQENGNKKLDKILTSKHQLLNPLPNPSSIPNVFVLLGDSEMAEGQVWEAIQIASFYKLNNLIAIADINRLGQSTQTMLGWDLKTYAKRVESFGWRTIIVDDGHDINQVFKAFKKATDSTDLTDSTDKPTMILAKTIKGKGVSFLENKEGWHGKPLNKEQLTEALKELGKVDLKVRGIINKPNFQFSISNFQSISNDQISNYQLGDQVATRMAYGDALVALGNNNNKIVVFDAEVSNSTFSEKFAKKFPKRYFEMFIAEQNMISTALGLSKLGFIPFVSTFAAFLTRGFDQLRMAQYSAPNLKIVGSHCGVSIGPDGPSQMGLEDLAMFRSILNSIIFYPADAVSTFKLTEVMANKNGLFYLRTNRKETPVIYDEKEEFKIGGSKVHKVHKVFKVRKVKALIIAAGITLHEALKAQKELAKQGIETVVFDCYSVKPLDVQSINRLVKETKNIIVVEDHYPAGGIGEAVTQALLANFQFSI